MDIVFPKGGCTATAGKAGSIPVAGYKSTSGTRDGIEGRFLFCCIDLSITLQRLTHHQFELSERQVNIKTCNE